MGLVDDIITFIEGEGNSVERDRLAQRLFEDQCEAMPEYARFVRGTHCTGIATVPPVPETVYKGASPRRDAPIVRVFQSSGTTGVGRTIIELSEAGLAVMNVAILRSACSHLLLDGLETKFLCLTPSPAEAPDVIMVYGMDLIARTYGAGLPAFYVSRGKIDFEGVLRALKRAVTDDMPVTLVGGSFAFVHLLDFCASHGVRMVLPEGSRTLDAGGFKSRSRELSPAVLSETIVAILGVPASRQYNILGMTELASQFYSNGSSIYKEPGIEKSGWSFHVKYNNNWTYTSVVDPGAGGAFTPLGMLCHVDLAVYDRPCALLTADIGMTLNGGFCFVRRASKNAIRGCSLKVEMTGSPIEGYKEKGAI